MPECNAEPTDALAAVEKVRTIRQVLADANPRVNMFQRDLSLSLAQIGMLRRDAGRSADAVEAFGKSLAIWERFSVLPPYDQFNTAMIHMVMAGIALRSESGVSRDIREHLYLTRPITAFVDWTVHRIIAARSCSANVDKPLFRSGSRKPSFSNGQTSNGISVWRPSASKSNMA
jgi:hypothetical protein